MQPAMIAINAQPETPKAGIRAQELMRIIGLCCRHRTTLGLGLSLTILFACFHTVSIGGAFPVFKLLLEQEGLRGWIERTVAGSRLGAEFAPLAGAEETTLRISKIAHGSLLSSHGVRVFDGLQDAEGRPASVLLRELTLVEAGSTVAVATVAGTDAQRSTRSLSLALGELDWHMRALRWAGGLIPAAAERDKVGTLTVVLVVVVAVAIIANMFRYFGEVLIARAILQAMMYLRTQLYKKTLELPMEFFAGQPTSDIVGRFVQDIQEIQRGMLTLFSKFTREPLRAAFILCLALSLDWRMTLVTVTVIPVAVALFWTTGRGVKKSNRKLLFAYGTMIGALTASLQGLRVVKAYTAEDYERERLRKVDAKVLKQQLKLAKLEAFISPMMEVVAVVAGSFMIVWLAGRVLHHDISMSKFAALGVTLSMLFDPMRKLTDVYVRVQRSTAGAERIFHVLDQPGEQETTGSLVELQPLKQGIDYLDVSYTYPGANTPALRNATLSIRKGETVAIVGPNGCGKTTLVSLLPRFFEPQRGEVRYDGVDIRGADLKSLRRQIGLVTQEDVVFAGTPIENIGYGRSSPDESRIRDAARRASAEEFILGIPGGYAANLGERGTTLSGGQRQRLVIARAIFREAPILIFDEATSQIDSESELKIQTALREFAKGRTTLIIAHRLSTIQFADRIIVMDAGRVIDSGTHEELLRRCLLYRTLCETQLITGPA